MFVTLVLKSSNERTKENKMKKRKRKRGSIQMSAMLFQMFYEDSNESVFPFQIVSGFLQ